MDKQLLQYEGSKKVFLQIGVITALQAVAIVMQAIYLAKAITQMFHGAPSQTALMSFAIFLLAFTIRHALQWAKERIAQHYSEQVAEQYRERLLTAIFAQGPYQASQYGTGSLLTLVLEGIPKFKTYVQLFIPRMLAMVIIPTAIVLYVLTQDMISGITLIIVLPVLIIFLILIGIVSKNKINAQMETYRLLSRHFVDSLRGLVTLKYLGKSKGHRDAIATVSNKYRIATNYALRYAFLSSFALEFFASLSVALVAVGLGYRLIEGMVFLEMALTVLILAPEYFMPVRELGNDFHATKDGQDAAKEFEKILQQQSPELAIQMPKWQANDTLTLQHVSLEGRLQELEVTIGHNERIGVVGSSGAGKSSLIALLAGNIKPSEGQFLWRGQTYDTLTTPDWRKQLSYIPQHTTIFAMTLRDNIRFYAPHATDEEVLAAIQQVGLSPLVKHFPNGLSEAIGQGGRTLSGGEEQRVALARALLQQQAILLFDEPTAHLDIETEHDIKQIMLSLFEERTVIFATHRLHWMPHMDKIIVLEEGHIVEIGSHEALIKRNGAYVKLRQAQRGEVE